MLGITAFSKYLKNIVNCRKGWVKLAMQVYFYFKKTQLETVYQHNRMNMILNCNLKLLNTFSLA